LSESDLDSLLSHARTEHHAAKHLIFAKESPGRSMMAVLRGRVKISSPSDGGREIVLAIIEADEIFGEMAFLDGSELANMLGVSRESVNKQLHVLQGTGLVEINKQEIAIPSLCNRTLG
jgi:CRP-like cAMP-binding protein